MRALFLNEGLMRQTPSDHADDRWRWPVTVAELNMHLGDRKPQLASAAIADRPN